MKKTVLLFLGSAVATLAYGQAARLVFNNAGAQKPVMVWYPSPLTVAPAPPNDTLLNQGTYLVIDHKSPLGIMQLGGTYGNIRSEAAQNKIRWHIADTTHATPYVIPYGNEVGVYMPLSLVKSSPGGGDGSIVFSTYSSYSNMAARSWGPFLTLPTAAGQEWDNRRYMAAANVTHMNDYALGVPDNSFNAVNRFWIVDAAEANAGLWTNYAVKPTVNLTFESPYADIDAAGGVGNQDDLVPGPSATATSLQAQRFNTTTNKWGDYQSAPLSAFTATPTTSRVSGVIVGGTGFYRAWTLSSIVNPLPVELVEWTGRCNGKNVELSWTTASELNSDYFTVEKSLDGEEWFELDVIQAAGHSQTLTNYVYVDERSEGLAYYRLSQTDLDGQEQVFNVIAAGCEANSTTIVSAWDDGNNLNVLVSSTEGGIYDVYLTDAAGKAMVMKGSETINKNYTQLVLNKAGVARGMYTISLINEQNVMSRRVVLM